MATETLSPSSDQPSTAVAVGFMSNADAKAEELAVLTGAAGVREGESRANNHERSKHDEDNTGGAQDVLELRGSAWEHVGLPRHRVLDVLLWAQRQVARAAGNSGGEVWGSGVGPHNEPPETSSRSGEEEAAEKTVARVTLGVLQGLLVGELPPSFAASVVNSSDERERRQQQSYTVPVVAPPLDADLDPFFMENPSAPGFLTRRPSWSVHHGQAAGDRGGSPAGRHTRSRQARAGGRNSDRGGDKSDDTTSIVLPLVIRLPEAFPALCQQVATAPEGASPRCAVIETLVASVHDNHNSRSILSVDCWQQYLLSIVSSAQGRQAVSTGTANVNGSTAKCSSTARSSFTFPVDDGQLRAGSTPDQNVLIDGETISSEWNDERTTSGGGSEERLVDQTVRLICWLAMCQAREGMPGRPGAGFSALEDTMSFVRCQAELGVMECISVGERVLRHMVSICVHAVLLSIACVGCPLLPFLSRVHAPRACYVSSGHGCSARSLATSRRVYLFLFFISPSYSFSIAISFA